MKKFDNFEDYAKWVEEVFEEASDKYTGTIAEQWYKDSREFTYEDTKIMYKSGQANSDFEKGIIIERTPYVRYRYYEGGKGHDNPNAVPMWFDVTKKKNIKNYKKMYKKAVEEAKK